MKGFLVATFVLASIASAVKAQPPVYFTSFETPNYVVGQPIDGVDGWVAAASPLAPEIVCDQAVVSHGRRALQCWGGSPNLESFPLGGGLFLLDGVWLRDAPSAHFRRSALVRVQCDMRLDGPVTPYDVLSANLIARNGSYNSAQMWLSSDGNVYCNSWGTDPVTQLPFEYTYQFGTPVPRGQYATMAITYDYSIHLAAFEVNGVVVGILPFGGPGEGGFNGVLLEFAALQGYPPLPSFDPSLYTGYWDSVAYLAFKTH